MSDTKNMKSVVGVQIGKVNASNGTDNYGLPIFVATDKPAWLLDWNGAMVAIDSLLKQIDTKANLSETELDALKVQIESANTAISGLQESVSALTTNVAGLTTSVTQAVKDIDTMQETVVQLTESVKTLETKVNENSGKITTIHEDLSVNDASRMHIPNTEISGRWISIDTLNRDGVGFVLLNLNGESNETIGTTIISLTFSDIYNNENFTKQVSYAGALYDVRFTKSRLPEGNMGVVVSSKKSTSTEFHDSNAVILTTDVTPLL